MSVSSVQKAIPSQRLYQAAVIIILAIVLSVLAILRFADYHFSRAVYEWQARLNLIADSRSAEVQGWVQQQFNELAGLANNASLQLYVTELAQPDVEKEALSTGTSAQQIYLQHLLTLTAERGKFSSTSTLSEIPANVERTGSGGIAILNAQGQVITSTSDMPPLEGELATFVANAPKGKHAFYDMRRTADGKVQLGFMVPIYAIQGEAVPSAQVGTVIGVKTLDTSWFSLLKHPGTTEKTLEAVLVRKNGSMLEFLSPSTVNPQALVYRVPYAPVRSAESYAIEHPGMAGMMEDAAQVPVLFSGRAIAGTPWILVQKIGSKEALAEAYQMRDQLLAMLFLALFMSVALIAAAWWQGASRKAIHLSEALEKTLKRSRFREALLKLVTNTQPGAIFLVDEQGRFHYANAEAIEFSGQQEESELLGKEMESVLGKAKAEPYRFHNRQALDNNQSVSWTHREEWEGQKEQVIFTRHVPVEDVGFNGHPVPGVLIVEENITSIVTEKERRERMLMQLTGSLVKMVDKRDPDAADHSLKVAVYARAVAREMRLDPLLVETAEMAGKLMNIGKITVPSEMLTRAAKLKPKEKHAIHESMLISASLLEEVEFDGPVVDTLRQSLEHYDGAGPNGLKGEDILVTARIVAVANAFTGMTSPRAYREAMSFDEAIDLLMKQSNKEFDRRVIVALANYLDNHNGRETKSG